MPRLRDLTGASARSSIDMSLSESSTRTRTSRTPYRCAANATFSRGESASYSMVWCEIRPTRERAAEPPGSKIPARRALPADGLRRPARTRRRVVFPAPLGPKTARHSPARIEKVTPASALVGPKARASPDASTIGAGDGRGAPARGGFEGKLEDIRLELA